MACGELIVDGYCRKCALPFDRQFCLGDREDVLKDLINCYKYNSVREVSDVLGEMILSRFGRYLKNVVLVPLPTIQRHVRERGFDHTLLLAKKIGRVECVLGRNRDTVQVGASEELRKIQARSAYCVRKEIKPNTRYVLLDDV